MSAVTDDEDYRSSMPERINSCWNSGPLPPGSLTIEHQAAGHIGSLAAQEIPESTQTPVPHDRWSEAGVEPLSSLSGRVNWKALQRSCNSFEVGSNCFSRSLLHFCSKGDFNQLLGKGRCRNADQVAGQLRQRDLSIARTQESPALRQGWEISAVDTITRSFRPTTALGYPWPTCRQTAPDQAATSPASCA